MDNYQLVEKTHTLCESVNDLSHLRTCTDPTPNIIQLNENGIGSLNISWSKVMIEGLVLDYTVVYINLENTSARDPMNVTGIQDQYFIFTQELENNTCEIYSFQVISVNSVGVGRTSDAIIWSLPTVPVAPLILEHSLIKMERAFVLRLTIKFNVWHN